VQVILSKIVILGTGGTIAGLAPVVQNVAVYESAQIDVADIWRSTKGGNSADDLIISEQLCQVDSKDMSFSLMQSIALRCVAYLSDVSVAAIVITHGTDTLEETAFLLACQLQPSKPIVLTGAMRPSNVPQADGSINLMDAVTLARDSSARGVWVVIAGKIHRADAVRKVHPYKLDAFDSFGREPAGRVESGRVIWQTVCHEREVLSSSDLENQGLNQANALNGANWSLDGCVDADFLAAFLAYPPTHAWPWVEVLNSGLGVTDAGVNALVRSGVQGIVMVGTGNATMQSAVHQALVEAQLQGVNVLVVSRCTEGELVPVCNAPELPVAYAMTAAQARMALVMRLLVKRHRNSLG
jgi:L-asparaginase